MDQKDRLRERKRDEGKDYCATGLRYSARTNVKTGLADCLTELKYQNFLMTIDKF